MNRCRTLAFIMLLQLMFFTVSAQDMLGTTTGNYAGINSLQLNPAAMNNSKTYLDIQLAGMDLFVQNNYLFMNKSDYRFGNFFKSGYEWPVHNEEYGTEQRIFYRYTNLRNKNAFIQTRVNGPGAMLLWRRHAFALTTGVRTVISSERVPIELANFVYLGLNYRPQHNINFMDKGPVRGAGMAWGEIGVSYSNTFYARGFNTFSAGISIKRLMGIGGMFFYAKNLDYTVLNDSTIDVSNIEADMGLAIPVDYTANEALTTPLIKGGGFGFDMGVTYTRLAQYHQDQYFNSLCSQPYEDYLFRVGIALIDIGGIKFKENATRMRIDNRSSYWEHVTSLNFTTVQHFMDTLSYKFYGDNYSAYNGNKFTLWLPAALSVQFDYHLRPNWYVNASLIYGFPVAKAAITRPAILSVTPRYETRWFEASMPVSLYNWQLARIGLALRFYSITIGTDKIGGFFHVNDFTGLDFYISVKVFFNKGKCRNKRSDHCIGNDRERIKR